MKDALKQGNWFIHKSRTNCIFLQHSVILCCGNLFCQHLKRKLAATLNQRKSFSELLHFIIEQSHSFESIGWFGLWTQISIFLWPGRSKNFYKKKSFKFKQDRQIRMTREQERKWWFSSFRAPAQGRLVGGGGPVLFPLILRQFQCNRSLLSWPSFVGISKRKLWSLWKIYLRWFIHRWIAMDHGNLLTLSINFAKIPTSPQNFAKHRGSESCSHSYTE